MTLTTILTNNAALSLAWNGGDLYLYGGPNLYRILDLLKPTVEPPSGLQAIEAGP
jgi:hypothetical protein